MTGGEALRSIREELGLRLKDVEIASSKLAAKYGDAEYEILLSRLSDIETKGVLPSLHRLYTLSVIYRRSFCELLGYYGIDVNRAAADFQVVSPPLSHRIGALQSAESLRVPIRIDPSFNLRQTTSISRVVEKWGTLPLAFLEQFRSANYSYAYIGSQDFTMYPLLLPGSFVQIDESRNRVVEGVWRSEYERPIYFVETREGYVCCWCALQGDFIMLQPHPLSPAQPRQLRNNRDAEVIGQVVGVAMRLDVSESPLREEAGMPKLNSSAVSSRLPLRTA